MALAGGTCATTSFENWCLRPACEAFEKAKDLFSQSLTNDEQKRVFVRDKVNLAEISKIVDKAREVYDQKRQKGKAWQWLSSFSSRLLYYGAVLDTLAQHHPEYVSLAWGTVKFIFIGVLNHEELLATFVKALCRIADCLPRQELALVLYPTTQIKQAVAQLYAHLIDFFIKALKWYQEGALKHALHSITQPAGIRYKDILNNIEICSRTIDQWAATSAWAELRDIHILQRKIETEVEKLSSVTQGNSTAVGEILKIIEAMSPQMTQLVAGQWDTNQRVFDLQLSEMLSFLANSPLPDPEISYRYGILRRNQHRMRSGRSHFFWSSPKLKVWTTSSKSSLLIVKGSYSSRNQVKDFSINVVEAVRTASVPILWVLHDNQAANVETTTIDLLKSLVQQVMRVNKISNDDNARAVSCVRFQNATSESEWFAILRLVLSSLQLVYIVVNVESISRRSAALSEAFSWPLAFLYLFRELASSGCQTVVKPVLISYGEAKSLHLPESDQSHNSILTIDHPGRGGSRAERNVQKGKNILAFHHFRDSL